MWLGGGGVTTPVGWAGPRGDCALQRRFSIGLIHSGTENPVPVSTSVARPQSAGWKSNDNERQRTDKAMTT